MIPTSNSNAPKGFQQLSQFPKTELPSNELFGFPVSSNQFNVLQPDQTAGSQSQEQKEEGLVDPRSTRLSRQAANRAEGQGTMADGKIPVTVSVLRDAQGIITSGSCVEPVASRNRQLFFPYSLSVSTPDIFEL